MNPTTTTTRRGWLRLDAVLGAIVLLECVLGAAWWARRGVPGRPPVPELSATDPLRDDVEALAGECRTVAQWRRLAAVYMANGYLAESAACHEHLLIVRPRDPNLLLESGFVLSTMGRCAEARRRLLAAIEEGYSEPDDGWYLVGRNELRDERPDAAAEAFSRAGRLAVAQMELARLRYRAGDAAEAMNILRPVLAREPRKIELNLLAYQCMMSLDDPGAAQHFAQAAADTTGRLDSPFYQQWERLAEAAPLAGARRRQEDAERLSGEGRFGEATAVLREANALEWNEQTTAALAELALMHGDPATARELIEQILDRRGPSSIHLATLANAHAQMNDLPLAIDAMARAVEAQSVEDLSVAYESLAEWSRRLRRAEQGRRYTMQLGLARGKAAFWKADWSTAETELASAARRLEDSPGADAAWFLLGETRRRLDQGDAAADAYRRCLSINPEHGGALLGLKLLSPEAS